MNPTDEDFERFTKAMQSLNGRKVWVHCAANARASAFIFRYRRDILGEDPDIAIWDLRSIWEPMGSWRKFAFGSGKTAGNQSDILCILSPKVQEI